MDNKEKVIKLIDESQCIIKKMNGLSDSEILFINKYSENLEVLKQKIIQNKIDVDKKHSMIGLFKWLGEYDNIIKQYKKLYDNIYEIEMIFTKKK